MRLSKHNKFIWLFVTVGAFLLFCGNSIAFATTWEQIIDYGYAGYSETGAAWRTYENCQSHDCTYRYLSRWERNLPRVGTASWTAWAPYSGTYRVSISYRQTENRSPDANYFVTNSDGGMDEFVVNQSGHNVAYIWKDLGVYHYKEGQMMKVLLDGTDDNYSDCADAAKWTLVELDDPVVVIPPIKSLLLKPVLR